MIEAWQRVSATLPAGSTQQHQRRVAVPGGVVFQPYQVRAYATGSVEPWQRVAVGAVSERWQVIRVPS